MSSQSQDICTYETTVSKTYLICTTKKQNWVSCRFVEDTQTHTFNVFLYHYFLYENAFETWLQFQNSKVHCRNNFLFINPLLTTEAKLIMSNASLHHTNLFFKFQISLCPNPNYSYFFSNNCIGTQYSIPKAIRNGTQNIWA